MNVASSPMDWLTAFIQRFSISAWPGLFPPLWGCNKRKKGDEIYDKLCLSSPVTFSIFAGLINILWRSIGQLTHQVFVQVGHLFLQLWRFDVWVRHSHHHNTPAQVIWEVDALAHLSPDDGEQQCPGEAAAIYGTPLTGKEELHKHQTDLTLT